MPRIRHDNDARYALRASFVDENGNVLQGDTIVISSTAEDPRITATDISNWNTAFGWGDHSAAGYLTTEADPTVPSHVKSITTTEKSNWNTAFGWGNHAGLYLPLSGGTVTGHTTFSGPNEQITLQDTLAGPNGKFYKLGNSNGVFSVARYLDDGTLVGKFLTVDGAGTATFTGSVNAGDLKISDQTILSAGRSGVTSFRDDGNNTWTGWESDTGGRRWSYLHRDGDCGLYDETSGQWKIRYNATQGVDLSYASGIKLSTTATGVDVTGVVSADGGSSTNWNTAFGWGNHSAAGYLTTIPASYTENNVNENISGHWEWQDTWQVRFGNSADSRMWWDGTANRFYHRNYTHGSNMLWQAEDAAGVNRNMLYLDPDDGAYVYHAGNVKLQTKSSGVTVTGNCNASNGQLWTNQQVRATGWWGTNGSTSWGGPAAELGYSGGRAYLLSYSRDASAYSPLTVSGLNVLLDGQGSGVTIAAGNTLTLGTVSEAPSEWNPILINDGGVVKQDSACRVHGAGYIQANYFYTGHGQTTRNSDTIFYSSTDHYIRKNTAAGMRSSLSVYSKAEVDALPSGVTNISDNVTGNYGSVQTVATAGTSGGWHGYNAGGWGAFMMNSSAQGGIYDDVNNSWVFYTNGTQSEMRHAGVTKGYTYSSGFRVTGHLLATSDVYAYYSDERLKTKTGVIENPLAKINAIETFYYKHGEKALELGYEGEEQQVGVSAQSVQAVLPEVVGRAPIDDDGEGGSVSGEDYITVKYDRIVPLLIEGIKELTAELESVKLELQELKANG